jgi:hypothetical protein
MTADDLRAALAAGILDETQAARLKALVEERAGMRAAMPQEDEPFEFFRGFSEIFISIGLIILLSGVAGLLSWFGGFALLTAVPLACAAIAWWWATYFTLKRRMNLPSMVLASSYAAGICVFITTVMEKAGFAPRSIAVGGLLVAALGMVLWYRRFRLPFSAFLTGLLILGAIYSITATLGDVTGMLTGTSGLDTLFDLRASPAFASATLIFGIGAFLVGMWFDTRDPHRLGRHAATAFWCHLLAAPALVNTVAVTLLNSGSGGIGLLAIVLFVITCLALVIDRRSFLTAAIAYIALVISWIAGDSGDFGTWVFILIGLGGLITAIGTWWVQLRALVMCLLPPFPGKDRLPPYSRAE